MNTSKISFLFMGFLLAAPILLIAQDTSQNAAAIDREIEALKHELAAHRLKEMNEEMQSQPLMFEEWKAYVNQLESAEDQERTVRKIEKQIHELELKKNELLKKQQ
jgi:hypothetical protein